MAINTRNRQDNNYLNYLRRVINDGGIYERVPLYLYQDQYNKLMVYNPYMLLFPSSKKTTGTLYNVLPNTGSTDIIYTRNSTASYVDSTGIVQLAQTNEPRLQYLSSTNEFQGLLIEGNSTNLLLRSEEFDNAYWSVFGTLNQRLANQTLAPNNTLTADLLGFPGTGQNLLRRIGITLNNSTTYAVSLFVKNNTFTQSAATLTLTLNNNQNSPNGFTINGAINFQNESLQLSQGGTVGSGITGSVSGSLLKLPNGWYQISVYGTTGTNATSSVASFEIGTSNQTGSCFVWGAQFESSSVVMPNTSYIPTVAATVTRQLDNPRTNTLNLGINSWSIFFEIEYLYNFVQQSGDINGFSGVNYIWYFRRLNNASVNFWNQNNQQNLGSFTHADNATKKYRCILTYDNNTSTINTYINGTRCGVDIIPTSTQPYVNFLNNSGSFITFRKVGLFGSGIDSPHYLKQFAIYNYTLNPQSAQFLTQY